MTGSSQHCVLVSFGPQRLNGDMATTSFVRELRRGQLLCPYPPVVWDTSWEVDVGLRKFLAG